MWVNKDTDLYCSFAKTAGNVGCQRMNTAFYYYGLDKVYKSFSVDNIESAVDAVRCLGIKGFAVTMPYKIEVLSFLDNLSTEVSEIGACNTVLNNNGVLTGYNTDVYAARIFLSKVDFRRMGMKTEKLLYILGDGGYSKAVQCAARMLNLKFKIIRRDEWNDISNIKDSVVYNCTPVKAITIDKSNVFIDSLMTTDSGMFLSDLQAAKQFELYTNLRWPL